MDKQKIPAKPSIKRLPVYLNFIRQVQKDGYEFISGTALAEGEKLVAIYVVAGSGRRANIDNIRLMK